MASLGGERVRSTLSGLTCPHMPREMIRSGEGALASAALEKPLGLVWIGVGRYRLILRLRRRSLHYRRFEDDRGLGASEVEGASWIWGGGDACLGRGLDAGSASAALNPADGTWDGCEASASCFPHFTTLCLCMLLMAMKKC
jgi:hypothetical protein